MNILSIAKSRVAKLIPEETRRQLLYSFSFSRPYRYLNKNTKKIIITLAADYGNLGDIAITVAQKKFLKDNFPDYSIIELPISRTYRDLKSLKSKLNREDIVTIIGGGNTGSLYESTESQRRFIIRKLWRNKIVAFPQSTYYDPEKGKYLLDSAKLYASHKNLIFSARDTFSYDFMRLNFQKNEILLCPDIVLSLRIANPNIMRTHNKATVSIRSDKESALSAAEREVLRNYLQDKKFSIVTKDTELGSVNINANIRDEKLADIWNEYMTSRLVVTDRLHGMIFCAITKTPCVAINNNNGKVLSAYKDWLNNLTHIAVLDEFNLQSFDSAVKSVIEISPAEVKYPRLEAKFIELARAIKG